MAQTLHASNLETATVTTGAFPCKNKEYVALFVTISAITGAAATLVVKLQESADGVNFVDVTSFNTASLTATGTVRVPVPATAAKCADYVRAVCTISGTTPNITFVAYLSTLDVNWQ